MLQLRSNPTDPFAFFRPTQFLRYEVVTIFEQFPSPAVCGHNVTVQNQGHAQLLSQETTIPFQTYEAVTSNLVHNSDRKSLKGFLLYDGP